MRKLIGLFCAVFVTSCAIGPEFTDVAPPSNEVATVYVYRMARWGAAAEGAHFALNGTPVFGLSSNGYSYVFVKPGRYRLSETWDLDTRAVENGVNARAGQTYYFRFDVTFRNLPGVIEFNWNLLPVSPDIARREIASARFQAPTYTGIMESNLPPGQEPRTYPLPSDGNQRPGPATSRPSGKPHH